MLCATKSVVSLSILLLILQLSFALDYGEQISVKANYHLFPVPPEKSVACQLPAKWVDGVLRVVAAATDAGYDKSYGCGNCMKVTNKGSGKSVTLMIIDEKGGAGNGLDIAATAYEALDNEAGEYKKAGHMYVDAENVACGSDLVSGNVKYRFKSGSNEWYFAISIVDHVLPVQTVALSMKEAGPFHNCKRSDSIPNYFDCNDVKGDLGGKFGLEMWIKVTAVTGEQFVDHLNKITPEEETLDSPLGKQFGGSSTSTSGKTTTTEGSTSTKGSTSTGSTSTESTSTTSKGSTSTKSSTSTGSSSTTESTTTTGSTSTTTKASTSTRSTSTSPQPSPTTTKSSGSLTIATKIVTSWQQGSKTMSQISLLVTNGSSKRVCGAAIKMNPPDMEISSKWNLKDVADGEFEFPSWLQLEPGRSYYDIGMIVASKDKPEFEVFNAVNC